MLFIVDEAHNFGSEALANIMPSQFKYRIALSATIERHMDKAGTDRLFQFFGDEVINYGLEDAINDKALVPYEYFPIQTAFIMSSSRNPKEFIQRRGRLLRRSEGKIKAVIYDFVTLPRDLDDVLPTDYDEDKSIILGELARINEFGKLAKNRETAEALMTRVMDSYGVYIDIEEETKRAEDYYGDKWT